MSGRIQRNVNGDTEIYFCPKKQKDWRKGVIAKDDKWKRGKVGERGCGMNRSLNIPITDMMVWELVMDVVAESTILKHEFKEEVLKAKYAGDEENEARRKKEELLQNRLLKRLDGAKTTLADVETKRLLGEYDDYAVFSKIKNNLKKEIDKAQWDLEQSRLRVRELSSEKKWLDWLGEYGQALNLATNFADEKKKEYLDGLLERIEVELDKETLTHNLKVFFRMGLVDDKIEVENPKKKAEGYKVIEGKREKSLVISRANVLETQKKVRVSGRQRQLKKKG